VPDSDRCASITRSGANHCGPDLTALNAHLMHKCPPRQFLWCQRDKWSEKQLISQDKRLGVAQHAGQIDLIDGSLQDADAEGHNLARGAACELPRHRRIAPDDRAS